MRRQIPRPVIILVFQHVTENANVSVLIDARDQGFRRPVAQRLGRRSTSESKTRPYEHLNIFDIILREYQKFRGEA
jgi:hypothetical protein